MTRRQFGWWTSVVLLAPSLAVAEPAAQLQQQAASGPPPPSGPLDELQFRFEVSSRSEHDLVLAVSATNTGKKGRSVTMRVWSFELTDGETTETSWAWMNDDSTLSRRIQPPAYVDLPAGRTLVMAHASLATSEEAKFSYGLSRHRTHVARTHPSASDKIANVVLEVTDDRGKSRRLTLAPFPITAAVGDVLALASALES